jgi:hypothetical protein
MTAVGLAVRRRVKPSSSSSISLAVFLSPDHLGKRLLFRKLNRVPLFWLLIGMLPCCCGFLSWRDWKIISPRGFIGLKAVSLDGTALSMSVHVALKKEIKNFRYQSGQIVLNDILYLSKDFFHLLFLCCAILQGGMLDVKFIRRFKISASMHF